MNWGKWNENQISLSKPFKFKMLGPAYKDRLFYLRFGYLTIRIMQLTNRESNH